MSKFGRWGWMTGVGCWVLGVGCWVSGVGCWVLGVGCWVLGVGFDVWPVVETRHAASELGRDTSRPQPWKPRFDNHLIEDERSLDEIREYIPNNPKGWELKRRR